MKPDSNLDVPAPNNRADLDPKRAVTEESEIDEILADSFPASDPPPWTLGVTSVTRRAAAGERNRER